MYIALFCFRAMQWVDKSDTWLLVTGDAVYSQLWCPKCFLEVENVSLER